ncbi:MAG: biotin--[acetyl-CoA-carboxylase] ligase [Bifidobacteriaceae bacterium]|nr:biotin--[acetyl-CoA-carboxylase] ligase [Bifidobacteriaceae bacterium]
MAFANLDRPPLRAADLRRSLVERGPYARLDALRLTDSTNACLLAGAGSRPAPGEAAPFAHLTALLADHQTRGRGRLDRAWEAPERSSVLASVLVRPPRQALDRASWLPLAAGLAVALALDPLLPTPALLAWPNDVVVGPPRADAMDDAGTSLEGWGRLRKVAGVLAQAAPADGRAEDGAASAGIVLGMGVNVSQRTDELAAPWATSLALAGAATVDRAVVARAVLRRLAAVYADWEAGRIGLKAQIEARCVSVGSAVTARLPGGESVTGRGLRLDGAGALVIGLEQGGERVVEAGEVRLCRMIGDA